MSQCPEMRRHIIMSEKLLKKKVDKNQYSNINLFFFRESDIQHVF